MNVEEGRHLWAMVYLLHSQFGRDGREEAEELLQRRSGNPDKPRILGAFNQPVDNWLDFFMFTMFTDRDGKYQLLALAESGFDPLARTTRFMLTEEAHHMFVGETGVERIVQRTAELMKADPNEDVRAQGGIPLDMIQRYLNLWFALSLDLFGGEISSNAASFFADGLKGRYKEESYEDHLALDRDLPHDRRRRTDAWRRRTCPLRNAMNEVLRDAYVEDCQRGVDRWNKRLAEAGLSERLAPAVQALLPPHRDLRGPALRSRRAASSTRRSGTGGAGEWLPVGRRPRLRREPRRRRCASRARSRTGSPSPRAASRACPSSTNTCGSRTESSGRDGSWSPKFEITFATVCGGRPRLVLG